jgi:hypothetical protein
MDVGKRVEINLLFYYTDLERVEYHVFENWSLFTVFNAIKISFSLDYFMFDLMLEN